MTRITKREAILHFNEGQEVWVYDHEHTYNEETEEYEQLMHPKSIELGDDVDVLDGYDEFYKTK